MGNFTGSSLSCCVVQFLLQQLYLVGYFFGTRLAEEATKKTAILSSNQTKRSATLSTTSSLTINRTSYQADSFYLMQQIPCMPLVSIEQCNNLQIIFFILDCGLVSIYFCLYGCGVCAKCKFERGRKIFELCLDFHGKAVFEKVLLHRVRHPQYSFSVPTLQNPGDAWLSCFPSFMFCLAFGIYLNW